MPPLDYEIQTALQQNPYFSGLNLWFETADGRVTLHGTVPSYYHKQMAQESLRRLSGVGEIENRLEVNWA